MAKPNADVLKRKKPAKEYDLEDVDFTFKHYSQMTATEIAKDRGLALFQVNQIVSGLRKAGAKLPKKTQRDIIADYVSSLKKTQRIATT